MSAFHRERVKFGSCHHASPPVFSALVLCLLTLLCILQPFACFASSNPFIVGNARFTIVSANCIRMEYAPAGSGGFIDAASIFAVNRAARWQGAKVSESAGVTTVNTGAILLTYRPDGNPFDPSNLRAQIAMPSGATIWQPGQVDTQNLGGTIRTLDGIGGPVDLGQGLLSRGGWALVDDSSSPLLTATWVESRPQSSGRIDWYLFGYGDNYRAALQSLATISGSVPMPRKYALGSWYSRYWPYSSADYREIVDQYGEHDFPLDNIVMDMDWHLDNDWTGWTWNPKWIPDPAALLAWFHSRGLHATINLHPADGVGPWESQYAAFMHGLGEDPASGATVPFDAGSKAYMDDLFANVMNPLKRDGVDFWWLDWQQDPYTRSVSDLTNLIWLNSLLYDYTGQGGQRGMSFSRWAGWGDQRHPIHFSGDADTGFPMLAFEVPFTSTAGNVGCFFWSHDIGGHTGGRNEESYTRWCQFGATSAVLRPHSTRDPTMDRRPWNYPKWAEDSMRVSFHLRSELFPYIYSSVWESTKNTEPLDRPMYFEYPMDERSYHNAQEYFLGDNILAAPIVIPGVGPGRVASQTIWFPKGEWYDYFTGEQYIGDSEQLLAADIDEFPLFVRGGVPIPMQPYRARMASAPLATLRVRCYPGADGKVGSYTLYEDDGITTGYRRGQFATTELSYSHRGDRTSIDIDGASGHYAGQPPRRAIVIELPDTAPAGRITVNGKPFSEQYDRSTFTNTVSIPNWPVHSPIVVEAVAPPAGTAILHQRAIERRTLGVVGSLEANEDIADKGTASALLWVLGAGVVPKNEAVYLYNGKVRYEFYAPPGLLDGNQFTVTGIAHEVANTPSDVTSQPYVRRGVDYTGSLPVGFSIRGKSYRLGGVSPIDANPLIAPDNLTATAAVTASGSESGYSPEGAVDGFVGGYPARTSQEWSSGQTTGAWLQLGWDAPQRVARVVLWDRPNLVDQVTSGVLEFSDGTSCQVGVLPNDASSGLVVVFPPKTIIWLRFTVTSVRPGTENSGLSEIAVYGPKAGGPER